MKLRNPYALLLAVLLALGAVSCGEDEKCKPCVPHESYPNPANSWICMKFVDESGKTLTLPESKLVVFSDKPGRHGGYIKTEEYTLVRWCGDKEIVPAELYDTIYDLNRDELQINFGDLYGLFLSGRFNPDATYVLQATFRCPALFDDDTEHRFAVVKRGDQFYDQPNWAVAVMFDGELVATNLLGSDYGDPPLRIVVKR